MRSADYEPGRSERIGALIAEYREHVAHDNRSQAAAEGLQAELAKVKRKKRELKVRPTVLTDA
jgi:hypothetical protein